MKSRMWGKKDPLKRFFCLAFKSCPVPSICLYMYTVNICYVVCKEPVRTNSFIPSSDRLTSYIQGIDYNTAVMIESLATVFLSQLFFCDIKQLNRTCTRNSGTQWTHPQMSSIKELCNFWTVEPLACKLSHKQQSSKCIWNSLTTTGTTAHNLHGNIPFWTAVYATMSNGVFCGTCAFEVTRASRSASERIWWRK